MALSPAITAANGQSAPLQQAQLVLSGSVMSTVAVGLAPIRMAPEARTSFCYYVLCYTCLVEHMLSRALSIACAGI